MPTRRAAPAASPSFEDDDDAAQPIPGTRQLLAEPEPVASLDLSPGERVVALLQGMGDDEKTSVRLYRRTPNSNALTWCQTYSAAEFLAGDFEMIRAEWGAGDYEIRVYGAGGLVSRENVSIANRVNAPAASPIVNQQSTELARIMQTMAESQARILEALQTRPDPQAQMMQTITLMSAMREAMGLNAAQPAAPQKSTAETLTEIVATMRLMKDISGEIAPKESDPDNPMSMLPGIIDLVKTAIGNRDGASQAASVPLIAAPASLGDIPEPAQDPAPMDNPATPPTGDDSEPDEMMLVQMLIKNYIGQIVKMIGAGKTPTEGGQFLYDKLPDEFLAALDAPNWFDQLAAFDARVTPHRAWIEAAKAHCDKLIAEDESGA